MLCSIVLMSNLIKTMSFYASIAETLWSSILNHNLISFWFNFTFFAYKQDLFVQLSINDTRIHAYHPPTISLKLKPQMDIWHPLLPCSTSLPSLCESHIVHHFQPFQLRSDRSIDPLFKPFTYCLWAFSLAIVIVAIAQFIRFPFNCAMYPLTI